MRAPRKRSHALALLGLMAVGGSAQAGGLEANGYNWDMIFDPATYAAKGTITYVDIDHAITNPGYPGTTVSSSPSRVHYNFGISGEIIDNTSCLVSAQNPFGSGTDRDRAYAFATSQAVRERISSNDIGLTCAYGLDVGPGVASIIGGISAQQLSYTATVPTALGITAPIDIDGMSAGWRLGVAYEIEEIALRVSAIYNSAVSYDLDGTALDGTPFSGPASANVTAPQSIELKAQTGVAPGWLVLGSVKWVDWSVVDTLAVSTNAGPISTDLNYRDGWTVTGGVGHALTPELTVLGTVTWDRGTASVDNAGVLENGTQTDRWGATLGAAYDISESVEFSGGVSYSTIAPGSNLQNESWDRGSVLAISASLKASF
ncbi:MAG TPA: hypothetical protein DIT93_14200 [Pelagibacterium sp.]|uniref:OmpP1/FadL family transporter n=1 Tax=uncultured Pelagibacterium sp. TaxID=1159875 RepID=UPI000C546316|nr:hypothetical protein [Pelagibacterium sp.]HCO56151.1 hypothetical protein [Pelagibacterium sp.]|tara:strand:- start:12043 stop:13164 length:1122 start_codon:yes stop_codon:yes gene_type:complete